MEEQWVEADKLHLYTDASSTLGYGLVLGPKWVYGSWPELLKNCASQFLRCTPLHWHLLHNVTFKGEGLKIRIRNYKHNHSGQTATIPLARQPPNTLCPVRSLKAFISLRGTMMVHCLHLEQGRG